MAEQIFISYAHKDAPFVHTLARLLTELRFRVWYDKDIGPGYRWTKVLEERIKESKVVLLVLSPNSAKAKWVENEFLYAEQHKKHIVPIRYQPSGRQFETPAPYIGLQFMNIKIPVEYHLNKLIDTLDKLAGREENGQPQLVETRPSEVLDELLINLIEKTNSPLQADQFVLFLSQKGLISPETARRVNYLNAMRTIKRAFE